MTKLVGVEFAPLWMPIARRRQTLAVVIWIGLVVFFGPIMFFSMLYLLFYTKFYYIPLLYVGYYVIDRETPETGGRTWHWFRRMQLWKVYACYFPINLVKEGNLDPHHNYIIGSHPHGFLGSGACCNFASEATDVSKAFPGMNFFVMTQPYHFRWPFFRDFVMANGTVSGSKKSIDYVLSSRPAGGNAAIIVVGGAREMMEMHTESKSINLLLKNRKGFIRMALKHGAYLVPSFSFGENEIYDQVNNPPGSTLRSFQERVMHIIGFPPIIVKGRGIFQYSFGILPKRRPITTVVGKPIKVEHITDPTQDEIDQLHSKYSKALVELFERHKYKYYTNSDSMKLTLI